MTVHFIGAGPGAPDLLTLRGRDLIAAARSASTRARSSRARSSPTRPPDARVVDTQDLTLDEIVAECEAAHARGQDVARLHSGDLSIYSAAAEQMRRLDALGIPWDVTPGVPAFAAAAASLRRELTIPEVAQTVILTRYGKRASAMPAGERARRPRGTRRHARDPSGRAGHRGDRRDAAPALRRGLPRRRRRPGELARRGRAARTARRHRGRRPRGRHPAHRDDPRRPRPGRGGLPRQPPLLRATGVAAGRCP